MSNPATRLALLAPVLAVSLALSACGGDTVSANEIEEEASSALAKQVGQTPKSIDCPSDLDAEEGAEETCTLTDNQGNTYDMTAKITSVSGDSAEFDFQVANRANN